MNTIVITCKNTGCNSQFRIPEFVRQNSTIKSKLNQECKICKNAAILKGLKNNTKSSGENFRRKYSSKEPTNQSVARGKNNGAKKRKNIPWKEKGNSAMIQHVQTMICNPYIRARDIANFGRCISCNSSITQAGHRYPVGHYPGMRFLINNIHGQEVSCNHHKGGNLDAYDRGLSARHGDKYVEYLKQQSLRYIRYGNKLYPFDVIEIGETYKYLHKNKIWIFTQKEFNYFREKACKK